MPYRIICILLLLLCLVAYVDTKSLKQYFDEKKFFNEYKNTLTFIGVGIDSSNGKFKVKDILVNTPADRSQLEVGDVLLNINGKKIKSVNMIKECLRYVKKHERIAFIVQKKDNSVIKVELIPVSIKNFEQIYTK